MRSSEPIRPAITPRQDTLPSPLSYAQRRLWFIDQLLPGNPAYNIPLILRLNGPLRIDALERSLDEVVRRHESLRTVFLPIEGGEPVQVVRPSLHIPLPQTDLRSLPPKERQEEARHLAREMVRQPFDLQQGPLLYAYLLRLGEEEHHLLLSLHHIITDGWSMGVLRQELITLYTAYAGGQPSPLAELPIQYADFARWQRTWLRDGVLHAQLAYWKQRLAGAPPILDLPGDFPRPATQSFTGGRIRTMLPPELAAGLRALSEHAKCTLFMTLLTAFQTLLARYSGQTDIVVGTTIANRTRSEVERLIGFFVNMLVLRTDLSGDPTFRELLGRVREVALGAYANQDVPFEKLVEEIAPQRSLNHMPLFQAMLVLQNAPTRMRPSAGTGGGRPDAEIREVPIDSGTARLDLTLTVNETSDGLLASLNYSSDLFEPATASRMLGHLQTLLRGIVADPDRPISRLPLLTEEERGRLLVEWNATARPYPTEQCLHTCFEAQVARTPRAPAVTDGQATLSYAELNRRADRLAMRLRALGVVPDTLVGLCLGRGASMLVGVLGILKAGGAYVPLDASYPPERLRFMLEDAAVRVLVTESKLLDALPPTTARTICLDRATRIRRNSADAPAAEATPASLAYLLYTSGSTGMPKGVAVEHRQVLNYTYGVIERLDLEPGMHYAMVQPLTVDSCLTMIFPALFTGGCVHVISSEVAADAAALAAYFREHRIDCLKIAPSHLAALHTWPRPEELMPRRRLIIGGEASRWEWMQSLTALAPECAIFNHYGPTETTVGVLTFRVGRQYAGRSLTATPLGRPLPNTTIYVLDTAMQPVPIGTPGELYIGGLSVARGYHNRPDLTAARFIPDVFDQWTGLADGHATGVGAYGCPPAGSQGNGYAPGGTEPRPQSPCTYGAYHDTAGSGRDRSRRPGPGARLYRTGDLVRYLPDGSIEFLGRIDDQVKIRGFRIELGEIETVLGRHPGVREAVVMARDDGQGGKRLVAYVLPHQLPGPSHDELRGYAEGQLPPFMVPAAFVTLDQLPRTPHGKADRRALPEPAQQTSPGENAPPAPPRTPQEALLAEIWAATLRLKEVGIHDNFFELGGDSILSIQVIARAIQAGLRLTPRQLFQNQTIAELAAVAGTVETKQATEERPSGSVALTPVQHRFFEQRSPAPHHYNQSYLLETPDTVDITLLSQAIEQVCAHHDALRLRFARDGSGWRQYHADPGSEVAFITINHSLVPAADQQAALEAVAADLQRSLDLTQGPLARAAYFDRGAGRAGRLLLILHHLIVDGVSWRILLEDIDAAYQQLCQGQPVRLPARTTSFQEWSRRLQLHARTAQIEGELSYWLKQDQARAAALPLDYPERRRANTVASARTASVALTVEETRRLLQDVPRAYRTQINDVLLTALLLAIARWTGVPALLLDLEGHGREGLFEGVDLSRTVGWFTSVFPVLLSMDRDADPGTALKAVKEQLRSIPARGIGYGVLRYLSMHPAAAHLRAMPASRIIFNYLGQFDQTHEAAALLRPVREPTGRARAGRAIRPYLLEINGRVLGGQLRLNWTYSARLHRRGTIKDLAHAYLVALRSLIEHCTSREVGGYTPSDFRLARLGQATIDRLFGTDRQIDTAYPLSPLQQGLLFHSLYAPASGAYILQSSHLYPDGLDVATLRRAWQRVVERHPILRTGFVWQGLAEPLQVVRRAVALPWEEHDWRAVPAGEQRSRLRALLADDRRRGFDLARAPLMRLILIRLGETAYRLVWSRHHLLLDGWSRFLLQKEVAACYRAFSKGKHPRLGSPFPYQRYIAWIQEQDQSAAEAFWRRRMRGFTTPTSLRVRRSGEGRPAGAPRVEQRTIVLSAAATESILTFARTNRLTPNTMVQGAWALLLGRYSGETDVVFGATVSGRPPALPGVESMIGLFINTLPVRVQMPDDAMVLPWLHALQDQQAEAREFEYSSLVQVQGWSEVPRGQQLAETLLVFENYPEAAAQDDPRADRKIRGPKPPETTWTSFPLTLVVVPGRRMLLQLCFHTHLYDGETAARLLGHLQTLLEGMVADPDRPLSHLPLLTPAEERRLLHDWNATARPYPLGDCLHTRFEEQTARTPRAPAVADGRATLSYAQLDRRANRLAAHLRTLGVGPDTLVGVCMERSAELLVALLGVLKAGGAWLPLDAASPPERLRFMLEDAGPAVLITDSALLPGLPATTARVLCLDREPLGNGSVPWSRDGDGHATAVALHLRCLPSDRSRRPGPGRHSTSTTGESLAYAIYTSGSTGRPKGVLATHRATLNRLHWMWERYPFAPGERCCQKTALSFVDSVWELFGPLLQGIETVIIPDDVVKDPARLIEALAAERVTRIVLVPSLLRALLDACPDLGERLPALRFWVSSGEALPVDLAWRFQERVPGAVLLNLYGSSEVAADATCYDLSGSRPDSCVPIGRPIANTQVYLLDRLLRPVPIGVPGEIHVGGAGLARGYLHRPELTEARFVPDPFSGVPGARLYRTGDLARYLPDGNLEYLGRLDHQVKVRGFRIELGEIESALRLHPRVGDAVVVVHDAPAGDKRLVAYVTEAPGGEGMPRAGDPDPVPAGLAAVLRRHLSGLLADYMVPSAFVVLDRLPLLPNGKVDRHALPAPGRERPAIDAPRVEPRTPEEATLARIWEQVLGIERIGIHDNFFELGGHSLLATQVLSRLRDAFAVELPLLQIFEAPTIAQLAELVVAP